MKKFTMEIALSDENVLGVNSENDGFTPFEIIGLLYWKMKDIESQIFGNVRPDVVTRKVVSDSLSDMP